MYFLGLDLGQKRDYSAVVVVEGRAFSGLVVRYAERMPLGTSYPRVVERVREIAGSGELPGNCALAVDATGVGAPVVDMLRAARLGCDLSAVVITGGERGVGKGSVAKRDLMGELRVLLEQGRLKIGSLREGPRLVRELADVREWDGRVGSYGAGKHDDLVIALELACWRAKRRGI